MLERWRDEESEHGCGGGTNVLNVKRRNQYYE